MTLVVQFHTRLTNLLNGHVIFQVNTSLYFLKYVPLHDDNTHSCMEKITHPHLFQLTLFSDRQSKKPTKYYEYHDNEKYHQKAVALKWM